MLVFVFPVGRRGSVSLYSRWGGGGVLVCIPGGEEGEC